MVLGITCWNTPVLDFNKVFVSKEEGCSDKLVVSVIMYEDFPIFDGSAYRLLVNYPKHPTSLVAT
jgi:hypothetical protein